MDKLLFAALLFSSSAVFASEKTTSGFYQTYCAATGLGCDSELDCSDPSLLEKHAALDISDLITRNTADGFPIVVSTTVSPGVSNAYSHVFVTCVTSKIETKSAH